MKEERKKIRIIRKEESKTRKKGTNEANNEEI